MSRVESLYMKEQRGLGEQIVTKGKEGHSAIVTRIIYMGHDFMIYCTQQDNFKNEREC